MKYDLHRKCIVSFKESQRKCKYITHCAQAGYLNTKVVYETNINKACRQLRLSSVYTYAQSFWGHSSIAEESFDKWLSRERNGSVVERQTPEQEVRGSKPTCAVLCP